MSARYRLLEELLDHCRLVKSAPEDAPLRIIEAVERLDRAAAEPRLRTRHGITMEQAARGLAHLGHREPTVPPNVAVDPKPVFPPGRIIKEGRDRPDCEALAGPAKELGYLCWALLIALEMGMALWAAAEAGR